MSAANSWHREHDAAFGELKIWVDANGNHQTDAGELHEFAARLGLRKAWFQSKRGRPWHDHYDIPGDARRLAVGMGAISLTTREMGTRQAHRRREALAARCEQWLKGARERLERARDQHTPESSQE